MLIYQVKLEMLESLMEIEVAFSLLKAGDAVEDKDPIDAHYEKLNTEIEVRGGVGWLHFVCMKLWAAAKQLFTSFCIPGSW